MNRYVITRFHPNTNKVTSLVVVSGVVVTEGACAVIQHYPASEHPLPPELEVLLQLESEMNPDFALVSTFAIASDAPSEPLWPRATEQALKTDAILGFNYSAYYPLCRELVDPVLRTDILAWADSRAVRPTTIQRLNMYVTWCLHRVGASDIGYQSRPRALNVVIYNILSANT